MEVQPSSVQQRADHAQGCGGAPCIPFPPHCPREWGTKARGHSNTLVQLHLGLSVQLGMVLLWVPDCPNMTGPRMASGGTGLSLLGICPTLRCAVCCRERRSCERSTAQARDGTRTVGMQSW